LGVTSWIREERENDVFPFPWSEKFRIELFATLLKPALKLLPISLFSGSIGNPNVKKPEPELEIFEKKGNWLDS